MAEHWETDSQTVPIQSEGALVTTLANDKQYASYVNDGHRMDKHFVPGLYIGDDGLLSRNLDGSGGLMVGTRTTYVKGLHITDKAIDKYDETVRSELEKLTREMEQ